MSRRRRFRLGRIPIRPSISEEALLAEIAGDPEDRGAWLVYADWLLERGDPRGRLVAAHARDDHEAVLALQDEHEAAFMGPFASTLRPLVDCNWRMGFWHYARVESGLRRPGLHRVDGTSEVVRLLLAHPSARLLHALHVGTCHGQADLQSAVDEIASVARPSLRQLTIQARPVGPNLLPVSARVELSALWASLPRLEALDIAGGSLSLGTVAAERLRTLTLAHEGAPEELTRDLARSPLPSLDSLSLHLLGGRGSDPVRALAALLGSRGTPRLRQLDLNLSPSSDLLFRMLAGSPLLSQLEVLIVRSRLTGDGARTLIERRDALRHLDRIELDGRLISASTCAALAEALPRVVVRRGFSPVRGQTIGSS